MPAPVTTTIFLHLATARERFESVLLVGTSEVDASRSSVTVIVSVPRAYRYSRGYREGGRWKCRCRRGRGVADFNCKFSASRLVRRCPSRNGAPSAFVDVS